MRKIRVLVFSFHRNIDTLQPLAPRSTLLDAPGQQHTSRFLCVFVNPHSTVVETKLRFCGGECSNSSRNTQAGSSSARRKQQQQQAL
jgi:hypothetical protein